MWCECLAQNYQTVEGEPANIEEPAVPVACLLKSKTYPSAMVVAAADTMQSEGEILFRQHERGGDC